jgi:hypothetical protein
VDGKLLEHHRTPDQAPAQRLYAGPSKPRELSHDAQLYRAYLRSADRLQAQGASIHWVVLEDDLSDRVQRNQRRYSTAQCVTPSRRSEAN